MVRNAMWRRVELVALDHANAVMLPALVVIVGVM
jgi:hypothetical protein